MTEPKYRTSIKALKNTETYKNDLESWETEIPSEEIMHAEALNMALSENISAMYEDEGLEKRIAQALMKKSLYTPTRNGPELFKLRLDEKAYVYSLIHGAHERVLGITHEKSVGDPRKVLLEGYRKHGTGALQAHLALEVIDKETNKIIGEFIGEDAVVKVKGRGSN